EVSRLILPDYQRMKRFDFSQLQFHFPDSTSFLRMHSPERFGDYLGNIRYSVREANAQQSPVRGFEEGRIFSGYRFVYPLLWQDEHIGSAEVSFSVDSFLGILSDLTSDRYLFAMNRSVVESTVFPEQLDHYEVSYISPQLMLDTEISNPENMRPLFTQYQPILKNQLEDAESFGYFQMVEDIDYLVLFHAVKNTRENQVGYIIAVAEDDTRQVLRRDQLLTFSLLFAVLIIIELLSWSLLADPQELARLSRTDQLTKVLNRRWFRHEAEREIEEAERYGHPLSLIIFDIDFFKDINDTFGHNSGDQVLQQLTRLVEEQIRAGDILARWGGEEFVVLLPHSDCDAALQAAEKLRQETASAPLSPDRRITISLGIAQLQEGETLDHLVGRADRAMYRAKTEGRNCSRAASG
ncbi:MAG: diguanylate cyclase, partial [Spirochaeta sp.]